MGLYIKLFESDLISETNNKVMSRKGIWKPGIIWPRTEVKACEQKEDNNRNEEV